MRLGMNSQCLRVIDGKTITDYHIEDGMTSSHIITMSGGVKVDLSNYEKVDVKDQSDPLSWGIEGKDKFTDINYITVGALKKVMDNPKPSRYAQTSSMLSSSRYYKTTTLGSIAQTHRKNSTDKENEAAFRKLFKGE